MKILFTGSNLRIRRRETILNPPKGIEFVTQKKLNEMSPDHKLSNKKYKNNLLKRAKDFLKYNNYIPKKYLKKIDYIYSPGKIILNRFPWFIEIDNPACLSYYNLFLLNLFKPLIRHKLKSKYCKGIICISEAAKKSMHTVFKDKTIDDKCKVIYPFIKNNKNFNQTKNTKMNLLFISTNFYLKGGRELVNSILELEKKYEFRVYLITKISDIEKELLDRINSSKSIKLIEANLSKKELKKYYLKSDLFILPTYQDSFGMVVLEALSFNLPIISTNMFAIPEMVRSKINGFLFESPINYFKKDFSPNNKWWKVDEINYIKKNDFSKIENKIKKDIEYLLKNKNKLNIMKINSFKLFNKKFTEKQRLSKLNQLFTNKNV